MTIENISNSVIDSSAVALERLANARAYMTSLFFRPFATYGYSK